MHKAVFSVLCLVSSLHLFGQSGKLEGMIMFENNDPVINAHLHLKEIDAYAVTDLDGQYTFRKVPFGEYTLEISTIEAGSKSVQIAVDSVSQKRNFVLKRSENNLEEVLVEGRSKALQLETNGFAVNAIETKGIALQTIQANELLDQSAGVRIRQDGGLGSRINYNINGLSGNAVRIFLDGIPIENYGTSFSLSSIPTSLIERIEVYKGVVPASLGTDALGGAINIISTEAARNSLSASYSYGSFNTNQFSLNGNFRDPSSGFTARASAFYNYSDNNYDVWGDQIYITNERGKIQYVEAERFHDSYRSLGSKFDAGFTGVSWADQFLIGAVVSEMDRDIQHGATMETVYGNRRSEQATILFNTTYAKEDLFVSGLDVNAFASYSDKTRKVIDTVPYIYNWFGELSDFNGDGEPDVWSSGAEGGEPTLNEAEENTLTGRFNLSYHINENNNIGINFLHSDFQRKPDDPLRPQPERDLTDTRYLTKNILGLTYEKESFNDRLLSSVFFKYYNQDIRLKDAQRAPFGGGLTALEFEKTSRETGYGIALSYEILPKILLMTSAENAIRLPQNQEVFGNISENIDPAYDLDPERSFNVNLGVNAGPFLFKKHSVRLNTNFFYRDTKGMIRQAVANQQDETFAFENQDEVLSTGVDAELRYSFERKFSFTSGMSIFNARFNKRFDSNGSEYIYYGDRLRNAPYFTLNNNFRYTTENFIQENSRTSFYYNAGYVHEFFRDWESLGSAGKDIIPSQFVNDLGVAYTLPGEQLTLSFDAKNIFNEQVFDNWALQKPGRAFYVKINYTIK